MSCFAKKQKDPVLPNVTKKLKGRKHEIKEKKGKKRNVALKLHLLQRYNYPHHQLLPDHGKQLHQGNFPHRHS